MQGDVASWCKACWLKKLIRIVLGSAMPIYLQRGNAQYEVADKIPELKFKVKFSHRITLS